MRVLGDLRKKGIFKVSNHSKPIIYFTYVENADPIVLLVCACQQLTYHRCIIPRLGYSIIMARLAVRRVRSSASIAS